MDHSYADALLVARKKFDRLAVGTTDFRKGLERAFQFLSGLPEPYRLAHIGAALTLA